MRQRLAGAGAFEENFRAVLEAAAVVTLLVESPLELLVLLRSHLKLMFLFRKLGAALNEESGVLAAIQLAEDRLVHARKRSVDLRPNRALRLIPKAPLLGTQEGDTLLPTLRTDKGPGFAQSHRGRGAGIGGGGQSI